MKSPMLRLGVSAPLALALLVACGSDLKSPSATPPPAVNFAPSSGIVPVPSDLLYSGTTDLTLNIPGVDDGLNPQATPPEVALSAMDGWSTSAPFIIEFNTALDAGTLIAGTTVRMFEVTLDSGVSPVGGPVNGVVGELLIDTAFTVGIAPESNGTALRVYLEQPLKSATSYMWVLTNGIQDVDGTPTQKVGEYLLASSIDPFDPGAPIAALQGLVGAHLAAAVGQGMVRDDIIMSNVFTTQGLDMVLNTFVAITAGQEAAIIAALCGALPSGCAGEDTTVDPNNVSSLLVNMPSTITTADRVPGSPGIADLYTGDLALPYYLTGVANPSDTATVISTDPLTQRIQARFNFLPAPLVDDHHVTSSNVLPASTVQEVIPVLISVPNVASGQTKPIAGWPVIVFQHGITRDRTDMLALADKFALEGFMMVAIDLPLHGFTTTADPVIFAGYDAAQPGARERNFGLDLLDALGASGPDGTADPSGSHFINLANLLVTRDNLRQSQSDLLHFTSQLISLDYDGGGVDVDPTRFHFVGHSLGGIVGIPFLALANTSFQSATLAMPGGGIAKLLNGSDSIGPSIRAGLLAAGVVDGTPDFEAFLWGAQTALDSVDPINYAGTLGASGLPIHFIEVVGGGAGGGMPDAVVPNSVVLAPLAGSSPTVAALGLTQIIVDTSGGGAIQGVVRFIEGNHSSILDPSGAAAELAAFTEMQAQIVEFAMTSGTSLTLVDETVVDTTP
ncbi:MAG: pimeloyl-ACP methyl ester carboxylesterase [Planctomycetota bacterium]|jgi:pimeloyl-ACP methyl ester carboxylesterase